MNGESDPALTTAGLARRCGTPAPTERIGNAAYSLWKVERPLESRSPRFSRAFVAAILCGSLALLALGRWVAERTRAGDFLAAKAFGIALLAVVYLGPIAVLILLRRRPKAVGEPWTPPRDVPRGAVAFLAGSRARGRSVGWLGFERDLMAFRGAGFDFRLRREDFAPKGKLLRQFRGGASVPLRRPKGITNHGLRLTPGRITDAGFVADPKLWKEMEAAFTSWESGAFTSEPSLFPPVRPAPTVRPTLGWQDIVAPPIFMGLLFGSAGFLLPLPATPDGSPRSPYPLAVAGVLLGVVWPLLLWTTHLASRSTAREADRAARQGL